MSGRPAGEIFVDAQGRTRLDRVRSHTYTRYLVTEHEDGTLVLVPAVTIPLAELASLRDAAGQPC
jgi:hypothetical protein